MNEKWGPLRGEQMLYSNCVQVSVVPEKSTDPEAVRVL